ncbi:MAG TPA: hypothetical protein VFW95_06755 [Candidatus Limnocylindria bacterium]|nr:hypothetical protein [Candidatus Limnocylindria bacterium]
MTRVLLVYHDADVADVEADHLRRAGYEVDRCAGPVGGAPCPVLSGEPCWQVEKADVLVYDTYDREFGHAVLVDDLLDLHPDKPLVLTSDPGATDRRPVVAQSRADLVPAIELAIREAPPAAVRRQPPLHPAFEGPHW